MAARAAILRILVALAIVAYVGVNFIAPLPRFLIAENLVYAMLYLVGLAALKSRPVESRLLLAGLAGFNAGRVSRSIIGPEGELMPLARDHIPLLLVLLGILVISLFDLREAARRS